MAAKYTFLFLRTLFKNLYFLTFFNGFLLASLFYFKMESNYENGLFQSIGRSITSKIDTDDTPDSIVVKSMHACYALMHNRASVFNDDNQDGDIKSNFIHPATVDLMTTRGACGSYSEVLARVLDNYGYSIRIAQMKANGTYAAHNIIEVKTDKGWVVLDPTYDVYFIRPDKQMASFADVKNNWNYYIPQLPAEYNLAYRYEDVRYSNWGKIPVIMPAVKKLLNLVIGTERANTISLRTYFLKVYKIWFYCVFLLYIPIFIITFRRFVKTKIFPEKDIPLTLRNVMKYIKLHAGKLPVGSIQGS